MNGHDDALHGLVRQLRAAYPGWNFAVRSCHGGPRLEAYRAASADGLYAVVTDNVAELRRELDNASQARA